MEYNKNTFCKANDKKVLHKIRKHWVVVSTALLMALGGGAATATHVSAHADANNNNGANTSSTDTVKENLNQKLQTPQQNNNVQSASNNQSAPAQNNAKQASAGSSANNQKLTPSNILKAAANLHGAILGNAAQNGAKAQTNNNDQKNQSQQSGNGFNAPKVNNNGAKANTSNPLKGVAPKMQVGQSNPADQANDNNNKVDFTRPRVMLGATPTADKDGLYTSGYTWNGTTAMSDDNSDFNESDDSYSDYGRITVRYIDVKPGDGDFQVGEAKPLIGIGSDYPGHTPDTFGSNEINHYEHSIPPLMGPYGTGYKLDTSNPIDSGSNINGFIGGKNQELTINVVPNAQPEKPGQVEVNYIDNNTKKTLESHTFTDSDNSAFVQSGFVNDPVAGYKTVSWNTSDLDTSTNSDKSNPVVPIANTDSNNQYVIQDYTNKTHQILNVYIVPETNNDSALVKYIDESDGSLVGTPRTIYGQNGSNINKADVTDYVPSGYTFAASDNTPIDGQSFSNGISGSQSFTNDNGSVVYVAVKKGTPINGVNIKYSTINVHYQLSNGSGGGTGSDIDVMQAVGPSNSGFNVTPYNTNVPDGYAYVNDNSNNPTTYSGDPNNPENVYVYVKKQGGVPAQVTNDAIEYESVDPSNPNAAPQVIKNSATNNYTFPIYGKPGTPIDYNQYTSNPPQGYVYAGRLGNHNSVMESNQKNIVLVESTQAPKGDQDIGTVVVQWIDPSANGGAGKVVYQSDNLGTNGSSFNSTNTWYRDEQFIPRGYASDTSYSDNQAMNFVGGQTEYAHIYVSNNGNTVTVPKSEYTDNIEYDVVDPNDPNSIALNSDYTAVNPSNPKYASAKGHAGDTINYVPYLQNVPSGYAFYQFGSPFSTTIEPNKTYHIEVVSNNRMPSPIYVNYINQDGQNVDSDSPLDTKSPHVGIPEDEVPIMGNYGETYDLSQLQSDHPTPTGYSLQPGQDNISVAATNHPQTIDLMVTGSQQPAGTLNIHRIIDDPSGHKITSDVVPVSIKGNTGDIQTITPSSYAPAPSNYYMFMKSSSESTQTGNPSDAYQVEIGNDGKLYQGNNGGPSLGTPIGNNNTLNYVYEETAATGTVNYEDVSDGDAVIGSKQITTNPNQPMNGRDGIYNQYDVTSLIPSGYNIDTKAPNSTNGIANSNNPLFLQGQTYVVYVNNAHTQGSNSTKRTGYGYVTVNYQESDGKGHLHTVASEIASGKDNSDFDMTPYTETTMNGGKMPDAYQYVNTISSVSKFNKNTPQTADIKVQQASKSQNPYLGKQVKDQINYVGLTNSDQEMTPNPLSTTQIEGPDGSPINYDQYTSVVPAGFSYAGMSSDIPDYTQGETGQTPLVATIYVKKTTPFSHNTIPGYHPANTKPASDGHGHSDPNSTNNTYNPNDPNPQSGNYFPWQGGKNNNGQGSAVLDGPENPFDPITAPGYTYNSDAPTMPNSYEWDNKGVLPKGYMPAWVPKDKGDYNDTNDYVSGYVPSDDIPSDYEAGFVPNGNGGYVPGFIPMNTAVQPGTGNQTNGGKKIPKYVPSKVPNGNGGTTNGGAPDQSPYATNSSATLTVQYVDAQNPSDVIQNVNVDGSVGSSLNFSSPHSSTYLSDVPEGYTFNKVLGQKASNGSYYTSDNSTDKFDNISTNNEYGFSDNPHTIRVALSKEAVADVIYEDEDNNNAQVGSAMLDGVAGEGLNFNNGGAQNKYIQLLPYNYHISTMTDAMSDTTPILSNGGTYVIHVHESHNHNAPSPSSRVGYSNIIIDYRTANGNYDLGTQVLNGKNSDTIQEAGYDVDNYTKPSNQGGYLPYGYDQVTNQANVQGELDNATFGKGNNVITIVVNRSNNNGKEIPTVQGHDKIEYVEISKDGKTQHVIDTNAAGQPVASDQPGANTNDPMTFDITGAEGSTIDYTPYETNVPTGFYFDSLGDHSTVIDGGHDGNPNYEVVYVRKAVANRAMKNKNDHIKINYIDNNPSDSTNGQTISTITVNGYDNADFDNGYYEDNTPSDYVYNKKASDISRFVKNADNNTQTDNIYVKKQANNVKDYGFIKVNFVDQNGHSVDDGHDDVKIPGLTGSIFNLQRIMQNTPSGWDINDVDDDNVRSFNSGQQTVTVHLTSDPNA